jgi:hypothetical protein
VGYSAFGKFWEYVPLPWSIALKREIAEVRVKVYEAIKKRRGWLVINTHPVNNPNSTRRQRRKRLPHVNVKCN